MPDAITIILPVHDGGERLEPALRGWSEFLQKELGREYEILAVDDGSTYATAEMLTALTDSIPHLRILKHDRKRGFGASLRTALDGPTHPIVFYTAIEYPHAPADLPKLLKRLGEKAPIYDREATVEAVSGCRTGRPVPAFWKAVGRVYRLFCRVVIGTAPESLQGWLGFRDHARSWFLWLAMGVPLHDVNSTFKVFRRSLLDRFPIQSDGDFVHAEIFAKITFLTVLIDEIPLTPSTEKTPRSWWGDFWTVFTNAKFHSPLPDLTKPAASGA